MIMTRMIILFIIDIDNLDWNIQIGNIPNTYQLYLQSLEPIRFLILAYDETRDVKYMDLALMLFFLAFQLNNIFQKIFFQYYLLLSLQQPHNIYVWA